MINFCVSTTLYRTLWAIITQDPWTPPTEEEIWSLFEGFQDQPDMWDVWGEVSENTPLSPSWRYKPLGEGYVEQGSCKYEYKYEEGMGWIRYEWVFRNMQDYSIVFPAWIFVPPFFPGGGYVPNPPDTILSPFFGLDSIFAFAKRHIGGV